MFFEIQSSINSLYYEQRITPVFIVDEVHMASTAILDDLRMLFNFKIDSANPEECRDYLSNRMKIAGCSREVFTPEAALAIFNISGGTSRVINNIATAALMYSAAKRADSVDEETVFQANIELGA
ncbi:hypothetical protein SDC9_149534 [bioreactor metagenome]|uniref:Uncharacterized protein n=1 Tax=bioreactor metagenome TaxID=1076179 RepID=A0A645EJX9_9ZZZZ